MRNALRSYLNGSTFNVCTNKGRESMWSSTGSGVSGETPVKDGNLCKPPFAMCSVMAEEKQSDLSASAAVIDGAFKLNVARRAAAMRVIIDEITSHSLRFEVLQQSLRQAFDEEIERDEREPPAKVEFDLKKARNVAEDLIRCVCTLRKLHAYRTSVEQRGFTPRQYKMITLNVKLKILAPPAEAFNDSTVDNADAALYMLSCFCRAAREEAVTSEQLRYWQESVDHVVRLTVKEALSPKKSFPGAMWNSPTVPRRPIAMENP
jgi:hypothetical protein